MSKFNSKRNTATRRQAKLDAGVAGVRTRNLAGGEAYSTSHEYEVASILLTSLVKGDFYRGASQTLQRLHELVPQVDAGFAARAAIFARDEFGMRSVTHALAAQLAQTGLGVEGIRAFFDKVVVRVDDMAEIIAYYTENFGSKRKNGKASLPSALKAGFRKAFDRFDGYQLGKYRGDNKDWSLVDIVNVVRPIPTDKNAAALTQLVNDELRQMETWESKLSAAGSNKEAKAKVWHDLVSEGKLGYMALLRNLRNIMQQANEDTLQLALQQLVNEEAIRRSRQFPYRYISAYEELQKAGASTQVLGAVSKACDISVANLQALSGRNLVIIDDSGSMTWTGADGGVRANKSCIQVAAPLAAAVVKAGLGDIMHFSGHARWRTVNPGDSVITIARGIEGDCHGGATDFVAPFELLAESGKVYDRIFLFSDMQGWVRSGVQAALNKYKKATGADPYVYACDLTGGGTTQLEPGKRYCALAGFSTSLLGAIPLLESSPNPAEGLVEAIKEIEL